MKASLTGISYWLLLDLERNPVVMMMGEEEEEEEDGDEMTIYNNGQFYFAHFGDTIRALGNSKTWWPRADGWVPIWVSDLMVMPDHLRFILLFRW